MSLAFPEIEEAAASPAAVALVEPAPAALDLSKINITDIALAQFGQAERDVEAAEKALKNVQHDLSTPTKLASAISLRQRLVNQPRADARKVSKALKSKLTSVAAEVTAREGEIVADFARVEAYITPQIDAREEEIEREKERDEARKADHVANIAKIAALLNGAEDKSAERLAKGIEIVDGLLVTGFEEFQPEAEATRTRVLLGLKALHQKAVDREAAAKLLAAQTLALEIGQRVTALIGAGSTLIRDALNLLELTAYPEDMDLSVLRAHGAALVSLRAMLAGAEKAEVAEAELAELRARAAAAQVPAPVPPAPAPTPEQIADALATINEISREPSLQERFAEPVLDAAAPPPAAEVFTHGTRDDDFTDDAGNTLREMRPGVLVRIPSGADALETTEADAQPVAPAVVLAALANALPAHRVEALGDPLLLAEVRSFVAHVLEAFIGTKFPTQPKPGVDWWADTRTQAEALQQQIGAAA